MCPAAARTVSMAAQRVRAASKCSTCLHSDPISLFSLQIEHLFFLPATSNSSHGAVSTVWPRRCTDLTMYTSLYGRAQRTF